MSKRILTMALALAMIFGSFSLVSAEAITDIDGHWAEDEIKYLLGQEILHGHGDGRFGPDDDVTRAQFVTMVNNALGLTDEGEVEFEDVSENAWYYKEIAKAMALEEPYTNK